jgi:hypothetical protein
MRPAPPLRCLAVALALVIPACFHDGGPVDTGGVATGSTGATTTTTGTTTGDTTSTSTGATTGTSTGTTTLDLTTTTTTTGPDLTAGTSSTSTGAEMCPDPGPEPNDDEAGAFVLGAQECNAGAAKFSSVLDPETDVDWYGFSAEFPGMGCLAGDGNPLLSIDLETAGTLRLCVYADCLMGTTTVLCPVDAAADSTPGGVSGCCAAASLKLEYNCEGTPDEDARVLVRLDQAPPGACVADAFTYSFTIM